MKRIEAIVQPHRLSKVVHALHDLPHFSGFTLLEATGQGHGRGAGGHHAGDEDCLLLHDRQVLVVVCEDAEADAVAETIARAAHTGNKGDGIVSISEVTRVLRVRDAKAKSGGQP